MFSALFDEAATSHESFELANFSVPQNDPRNIEFACEAPIAFHSNASQKIQGPERDTDTQRSVFPIDLLPGSYSALLKVLQG